MTKLTSIATLMSFAVFGLVSAPVVHAPSAWADDYETPDAVKSDTKKAGHDVKEGSSETYTKAKQGTKRAGKKTKKNAKKTGKKAANTTGNAANDAADKLHEAGK